MPSGPYSGEEGKLHSRNGRNAKRTRRRFRQLKCVLVLAIAALRAAGLASPSPALHTIQQVRTLAPSDAGRGYPVHLERAQVSYVQSCPGTLFLMDRTGGIRAQVSAEECRGIGPGDLVTVDGATGVGQPAPLIVHARIRLRGRAVLPPAPLVDYEQLNSGTHDADWVAVSGIIQAAVPANGNNAQLLLSLSFGQDQVHITTAAPSVNTSLSLVDAKVQLRAVVDNRFNARNLVNASDLFMPDLSFLQVLEGAPPDPFALRMVSVGSIGLPGQGVAGHRVHTRGIVTYTWGAENFAMMGEGRGIFVTSQSPAPLKLGDLVDVVGFPSAGEYTVYLDHATVHPIDKAPVPQPVHVTAAQTLSGEWDAQPIETEGVLVDSSPGPSGIETLLLNENRTSFIVVMPRNAPGEVHPYETGSRLRVSGICVIHTDNNHNPRELNVLLRSSADVQLLKAPPWWTLRHALLMAGILAGLVLIAIVWNALLSRQVRAQTRQIRAQLDQSRKLREQTEAAHQEKIEALANLMIVQNELLSAQEKLRFQATHDPLTGLWNRAALLDALHREVARMLRTGSPMAVLLLDVDHFKQVNDTHGHLVGDAVLQEIGRRITGVTRPYDVAGRYGGEEFLVILPECGPDEARHSAERIRLSIGSAPIRGGEAEVHLTVSVGATVTSVQPDSEAALLREADLALYQAKSAGRNRAVLYGAELAP